MCGSAMGEKCLRVLHGADLHLDSPFSGLPEDRARQRRRESREVPDLLAEVVEKAGVDLVLLSGDLFDGDRVYPETLERLTAALKRMECPVCIAPGNHDPYRPGSPYCRDIWPENVYIFHSAQLERVDIPGKGCSVWGAAFREEQRTDQVLRDFHAPDTDGVRLGCLHGDFAPDSRYGPLTREQIRESGLHYLALGHIHRSSGIQREGKASWAYSGCTEGRGFDETGEKGVLLLDLTREGIRQSRFLPLGRRTYRILEADVTEIGAETALAEALTAADPGDICRVILTGETGESLRTETLTAPYRETYFGLEVLDRTRPSRDIWERAGEESLRGLFLSKLKAMYSAAGSEAEKRKIIQAVRYGLGALDGRDME